MRKAFYGALVIKDEGELILTKPLNSWDTNYHLYDTLNKIEYLIDLGDIGSDESDLEHCAILFNDLLELDLNDLIDCSWKSYFY